MAAVKISREEINQIYKLVSDHYVRFLKKFGIVLPKLKNSSGKFQKDALALVYLAYGYPKTRKVSKSELTEFLRTFDRGINDSQQARHLSAQKGWNIVAGSRGTVGLRSGEYQLISLEEPYPGFHGHRITDYSSFDEVKKNYGMRCATCGSVEDQPHLHWPDTITKGSCIGNFC